MSQSLPSTILCDLKQMSELAKQVANIITPSDVIALFGNLGTGKTTFTRFLCKHLSITSDISSPTYGYLNIYDDKITHFDLYRLTSSSDFFALGFEEYLHSSYISIIEWPEIIDQHLPKNTLRITISHKNSKREISFNA